MNLITGGSWKGNGSFYRLYLNLPSFIWTETRHMRFGKQHVKELNLATKFMLTSNKIYCNIGFSVLGFGLGLEIHSKESNET